MTTDSQWGMEEGESGKEIRRELSVKEENEKMKEEARNGFGWPASKLGP